MARPRFSEELLARRRELGLSVSQASSILRLREEVLVAFEEGDWDRMPQEGYAQGMLSSYASYLGLSPREVVSLFQEELYEHKSGTSSHALRRRTRDARAGRGAPGLEPPAESGARPRAYVEYRPLLPTSGGPAGDLGDFATTASVRPRRSVPLAGTGVPAPGTRTAYPGPTSLPDGRYQRRRPYNAPARPDRARPSSSRRRTQAPRRRDDEASRLISERQSAPGGWVRDDVSYRRARPGEYTDDMRLDASASSFAPASTISGRRSSRNIAPVQRPNVRRRQPGVPRGAAPRGGRRQAPRGGLAGFFSDPRRTVLVLAVLLAAVLTGIVLFSVRSCVGAGQQGQGEAGKTVSVNDADRSGESQQGGSDETDPEGGSAQDPQADEQEGQDSGATDSTDDASGSEQGQQAQGDSETVVEVSVASGKASWVEIVGDGGESLVADTVVGPWSQGFTVGDSLSVTVAEPDAVTVTKNGQKVSLSSKVGGMGSVTIKGTAKATGSSESQSGDGQQEGSTAGTGA